MFMTAWESAIRRWEMIRKRLNLSKNRFPWILCAGYAVYLITKWTRCRRAGRAFPHILLTSVVVWAAVYLGRALGRSDGSHIDSALPPVCLLLAHGSHLAATRMLKGNEHPWQRRLVICEVFLLVLGSWFFLSESDTRFRNMGRFLERSGDALSGSRPTFHRFPREIAVIEKWTRPDDVILDVAMAPAFHVFSGRRGPGTLDAPAAPREPSSLFEAKPSK